MPYSTKSWEVRTFQMKMVRQSVIRKLAQGLTAVSAESGVEPRASTLEAE